MIDADAIRRRVEEIRAQTADGDVCLEWFLDTASELTDTITALLAEREAHVNACETSEAIGNGECPLCKK